MSLSSLERDKRRLSDAIDRMSRCGWSRDGLVSALHLGNNKRFWGGVEVWCWKAAQKRGFYLGLDYLETPSLSTRPESPAKSHTKS